jgi:hypothetical protein
MVPERETSAWYREHAAICAWCAEQTISAEAAAALLYLEQMWTVIAEVTEVIEANRSGSRLSGDLQHLAPD